MDELILGFGDDRHSSGRFFAGLVLISFVREDVVERWNSEDGGLVFEEDFCFD